MKVKLSYSRISARKLRLLADVIRGKDVSSALRILKLTPKKGARILEGVLKSAIANAEQKHGVDLDVIYIQKLLVDQGPVMQRWRPRAQGRATPVRKKMSHISMTLAVR